MLEIISNILKTHYKNNYIYASYSEDDHGRTRYYKEVKHIHKGENRTVTKIECYIYDEYRSKLAELLYKYNQDCDY